MIRWRGRGHDGDSVTFEFGKLEALSGSGREDFCDVHAGSGDIQKLASPDQPPGKHNAIRNRVCLNIGQEQRTARQAEQLRHINNARTFPVADIVGLRIKATGRRNSATIDFGNARHFSGDRIDPYDRGFLFVRAIGGGEQFIRGAVFLK